MDEQQKIDRFKEVYGFLVEEMFPGKPSQEDTDRILKVARDFFGEEQIGMFEGLPKLKQLDIITFLNAINMR